ncbi:MAG: glycosyltransferase [Bacteroidales bacterium]|nr:glycosyltransferase [Bacteroidales bacterium]
MSPIVIFVYNRPDETRRLLHSLLLCPEAEGSELFVFSDGAKREADKPRVEQVRQLFASLQGFQRVTLKAQEHNIGLSRSIIGGVSEVLQRYGQCIVLEDDLIVAPDFLTFMNSALDLYRDRHDIFSLSGYTPNIPIPDNYQEDVFLVPRPQTWGWATWSDRWATVDWSASEASMLRQRRHRKSFDKGGNDLSRTMAIWQKGHLDVWGIRWVFACWRQGKWTLNPVGSKVSNDGLFEKATHAGWHDDRHRVSLCLRPLKLSAQVQPNEAICAAFKRHHDLGLVSKIGYFLREHNLGYKQIKRLLHR